MDFVFDDLQDSDPWVGAQQWSSTDIQALFPDYNGVTQQQSFNDWSSGDLSDPHALHSPHRLMGSSGDLEHIYTELHKSVDLVVFQISTHIPPRLDQIRQRNRELIEKLTSLDNSIATSPTEVGRSPSASTQITVTDAHPTTSPTRETEDRTGSLTGSENTRGKNRDKSKIGGPDPSIPGPLKSNPSLARKLLQIGNAETKIHFAEFAAHLEITQEHTKLPELQPPNASPGIEMPQFLLLIQNLGQAILSSSFGERQSRVRNRIALAQFYHTYTVAQSYPEKFLAWCNDQPMLITSIPPKGRIQSVVQHRFADLILLSTQHQGNMRTTRPSDTAFDGKQRIARIQMWRKNEKKWAHIIQRFGYGILLLVPSSLADEDLRLAHDEVFASALDFIDSRKHSFAEVLQQANDLLTEHFFASDSGTRQVGGGSSVGTFEVARLNNFFDVPLIQN